MKFTDDDLKHLKGRIAFNPDEGYFSLKKETLESLLDRLETKDCFKSIVSRCAAIARAGIDPEFIALEIEKLMP